MNAGDTPFSDLLDDLPVPEHADGFWTDLEAQLAEGPVPGAGDRATPLARSGDTIAEVDGAPVVDLSSRRARRWAVAVAAAAVAVITAVVGLSAIGDDDPPTITDDPPISTTTTEPDEEAVPDPEDLAVVEEAVAASLAPALRVSDFASPAGYEAPTRWVDDLTPAVERYVIRWFGASDDPDDPFRDGDLALVSVPALESNVVFAGLDPYRDFDHLASAFTRRSGATRQVAVLSRTLDEEELGGLIDTVVIDGDRIAFALPSGYREVAASSHASPNGPVHDHNLTFMNYRSFHRMDGFWWTEGGVPGGEVWVWAAADAADRLPVAGYFAIEAEDVDVGGRPGILGTYHGSKPRVLSFIDNNDTLVMIGTDDPSLDLVAMATSVADAARPAEPLEFAALVHSAANPALSATTVGLEWSVFPRRSGVGVEVCFAHGPLGAEEAGTHCSMGGVVTDWGAQGFNPWNPEEPAPPWGMVEYEGEYWMTFAGRAPDCVVTVEVQDSYALRRVQTPTVVADDGHRWFMLAVPMAIAGTGWEDIPRSAVLKGLGADGRLVDASDGQSWVTVDPDCETSS